MEFTGLAAPDRLADAALDLLAYQQTLPADSIVFRIVPEAGPTEDPGPVGVALNLALASVLGHTIGHETGHLL
jgi:hypothetical protein